MTIMKHLLVGGVVIGAIVGFGYMADKNGYNRAIAKVNAQTAIVIEQAKKEQAETQAALTDVVDKYYQAVSGQMAESKRLERIKQQIRGQPHAACKENSTDGTMLPSIYRMFNAAADHRDLPAAIGSRFPDDARDGLDAIQYAITDRHRLGVKVTALQKIIKKSGCFVIK